MGHSQPPAATLVGHPLPYLATTSAQWQPASHVKVARISNPLPRGTLGDTGLAAEIQGPPSFPQTILVMPYNPRSLAGLDPGAIRMFRWDPAQRALGPVWNSGTNVGLRFVWAKITRPGVYVPIGLPRDRIAQELLRSLAKERRLLDDDSLEAQAALTRRIFEPFLKLPDDELQKARRVMTSLEVQTGFEKFAPYELTRGHGGHLLGFRLPNNDSLAQFKQRIAQLETPPGGLPEEQLFYPPETLSGNALPWDTPATLTDLHRQLDPVTLRDLQPLNALRFRICWLYSPDWWMYHHDDKHSGDLSGCSDISSINAGSLYLKYSVPLNGTIITIPTVVDGQVYVGTTNAPGGQGTLYKIDLATGTAAPGTFTVSGVSSYGEYQGIGGSPAVVDGRVYFTALHGRVYCTDAANLTNPPIWVTDLRNADLAQRQPVQNNHADSWTSPLVVNGKVYVGCGEGENNAFGFVYCLDATDGHVIWLFCANKFENGVDNSPNVIPASTATYPLPAGFSTHADPPVLGSSVWSSCAYDTALNRIYVGTGNSSAGDLNALPDPYYGSGVLALDADTGAFQGFFQPAPADNYRPDDNDADVCGSPLVFHQGGATRVAIGTKAGAFFVLDGATMTPVARRQLLPKDAVTGAPLESIDVRYMPGPAENTFGIFGTPAIDYARRQLFVGLGGYGNAIDSQSTPFMRAVDWNTLADTWATTVDTVGTHQVARYTAPRPPMYTTSGETGLSSPAVIGDVVFVSTGKPGLYALDTATGLCLWSADGVAGDYVMGPAVYGNYVVVGCGNLLNIYTLRRWRIPWRPPLVEYAPPWWWQWPPPPPPPPDGYDGPLVQGMRQGR